ncbi:hypothetical protein [Polyangium sp. 15x6]|uniref:hypothetical protein n=1 Tax=Polyangium sp. 15x6 TaxID=3042687 RepID=UPI00249B2C8C|nr:hypothetical protein [Polyangium sp. 15x6]MDI3282652.1 hypothetical protein [Polyangium sp. 15x6]
MKQAVALSMVALGLALAAGCGAKVVVDTPGEGAGGAGGTSQSSSDGPGTITSVGPGSSVSSVGPGPGPGGPSVVSSISSGPMTCDNQGDCGFCVECATSTICNGLWTKCLALPACEGLLNCLPSCQDQLCFDKCLETFPDGIALYNETAICLVCQGCFNDCDGASQGCP